MTRIDDLAGRAVLITGASSGIGAAVARTFGAQGARLALHYNSHEDAARELAEEIGRSATAPTLVRGDLSKRGEARRVVDEAATALGGLDVLINNASTFYPTPLGTVSPAQWDDLMGTNLRAPFFLAQAAAAQLRASKGAIVNMIDIHAQRPLPRHPVYSSAKAGLAMLTRSLARELGPEVRVNGIAPGPIMWPEAGMDAQLQKEIVAKTLLKRSGSPEDVVRAALFFVKDAPYVTGQILAVDGGRSVGW